MKKTGFVIGLFATAFGITVANKMQKINANKDSAKGKAKELAGDVVGSEKLQAEGKVEQAVGVSKEVLEDLKESVSSVFNFGTTDKVAGKRGDWRSHRRQKIRSRRISRSKQQRKLKKLLTKQKAKSKMLLKM